MTSNRRRTARFLLLASAIALSGCGTVKEKTAPCKRPSDLLGYGPEAYSPRRPADCGPLHPVNGDGKAALRAIDGLAAE